MVDWESGATPAWVFLVMLFSIAAVMLVYIILNDYVTIVFYDMAIANAGKAPTDVFDLIVAYWQLYFIIAFVISMVVWAIVQVMRGEEAV